MMVSAMKKEIEQVEKGVAEWEGCCFISSGQERPHCSDSGIEAEAMKNLWGEISD